MSLQMITSPAAGTGSAEPTRLTVLVAGAPGVDEQALAGSWSTGRLSRRDETGSEVFELSAVAAHSPDPVGGPVLGVLVVSDPSRLTDCAPLVADLRAHGRPFVVVAVDGGPRLTAGATRRALDLPATQPVLTGDRRDRGLVLRAMTALTERALHLLEDELEGEHPAARQAVAG